MTAALMIDIAVCMAAYNRRERTLDCLKSLFAANLPAGARLAVYLLDDNSTDGTSAAVEAIYPQITILQGDGACYWAGGMRRAYGLALEGPYTHFLWLNDDVELLPDALTTLLGAETALRTETGGEVILAGAMMDRVTGATTYSGLTRSSRLRGWKLRRQEPHPNKCISCETLNGNLVLIPRAVADKVGNIDPHYVHNLADIDYGFRARRFGISLWLIPGYAGYCAPNTSRPSWKRAGLTLTERIKLINSPLGIPVRANFEYAIGHFGVAGPWVFSEPYLSLLLSHFRRAGGPKS